MAIQINKLLKNGKAMFLACDQGMEHGPRDFNEKNIDPDYILDIALEGHYNAVILGHGLAEKYHVDYYTDVPLIVKLNGKTSITQMEPYSEPLCSVERAIKLGASAVGYTIYNGSERESEMMIQFSKIVDTAHDYGLPAIAWMYPRGTYVPDPKDTDLLAYVARIGAELGADIIKISYNGDLEGFKWVVKCAGRTKVVISGGSKESPEEFLQKTHDIIKAGAAGIAVGRNVWQSEKPYSLTKAIEAVIFHKKSVEEAKKLLE